MTAVATVAFILTTKYAVLPALTGLTGSYTDVQGALLFGFTFAVTLAVYFILVSKLNRFGTSGNKTQITADVELDAATTQQTNPNPSSQPVITANFNPLAYAAVASERKVNDHSMRSRRFARGRTAW